MTAKESNGPARRIIGLFPELLSVGGIQEAGRLTAAALDAIAGRHDNWQTSFLSLGDAPGEHQFEVAQHRVSLRGFGRSKVQFVASAVGQARKGAQLVLAAHPNLALPAVWMKWVSPQLKTIVMSHGVEVWEPLPRLRCRALLSADLALAPSTDTAQKLAEVQGVSPAKIRKLAWPLNPNFLQMADTAINLALPKEFPTGRVILTVGRWAASERYKGVDDLIRAMQQLRGQFPGLHLVAVGEGDDLPRLQKIAGDWGVSGSVRFLTGLSREEIAACYAHSEIFALPSAGEGFGLVFLEAMAFGKPLVGAACGGTMDIVEDNVNGLLVPPNDLKSLIAALERLLENESRRADLGRRSAEIVRRKFQFPTFQSELEKILEECSPKLGERRTARDV
jgi:phosphatidylinositol alpha-1,6-mannosyltransferase